MRRQLIFLIILIFIIPNIIKNNHINGFEESSIIQLSDDVILPSDDEDIYYKHTKPNSATIKIANDLIDNNSILLLNYWDIYVYPGEKINWSADPFDDITWDFYFHSLWMVNYLLDAYSLTLDDKYLVEARDIILSWNQANPDKQNQSSISAWKDHSTSNRLTMYVHFWDYYKGSNLSNLTFESDFMSIIHSHTNFTADPDYYAWWNNHGLFQSQALLQIGVFFPEFTESEYWIDLSKSRISTRISTNVTDSGIYKEHSTSYHYLALKLFMNIKTFCDHYSIEFSELDIKIDKMQEYMGYAAKIDGTVPMIGDSSAVQFLNFELDSISNDYLLFRTSNGVEGIDVDNPSIVYPDAGVAIFKNDWDNEEPIYLNFVNRYHSVAHKHADDLSFVLSYGQTDFFVDGGKYNYVESDPYRMFIRSTFAHNTITVDNQSYAINDSSDFGNPKITNHYIGSDFNLVEATHSLYDGVEIFRTIIFFPDGAILINDRVESLDNHYYTQVFNLGTDVELLENGISSAQLSSKLENKRINIEQLKNVDNYSLFYGSTEPIQGWQSSSLNEVNPINSLHFSQYGSTLEFQTAINIGTSIIDAQRTVVNNEVYFDIEFTNGSKRIIKLNDFDNDETINELDLCDGFDDNIDLDNDGIPDGCDNIVDFDRDGVAHRSDFCPNTIIGSIVNNVGCSTSQLDTDGDGVTDNLDLCSDTNNQSVIDSDGCIVEDIKSASSSMDSIYVYVISIIITFIGLISIFYFKSRNT